MTPMRGVALCALLVGLFGTNLVSVPVSADDDDPLDEVIECSGVNEAVYLPRVLENPLVRLDDNEGFFFDQDRQSYGLFVFRNPLVIGEVRPPGFAGDAPSGILYYMTGATNEYDC